MGASCAVGGDGACRRPRLCANLAEGVGGPQDATILLDPEDVIASAAELPVDVEPSPSCVERDVEGSYCPALDTVVLFRKRALQRLTPWVKVDQ